jgi:hypothetical protein
MHSKRNQKKMNLSLRRWTWSENLTWNLKMHQSLLLRRHRVDLLGDQHRRKQMRWPLSLHLTRLGKRHQQTILTESLGQRHH